jgi:hypothetical protein
MSNQLDVSFNQQCLGEGDVRKASFPEGGSPFFRSPLKPDRRLIVYLA